MQGKSGLVMAVIAGVVVLGLVGWTVFTGAGGKSEPPPPSIDPANIAQPTVDPNTQPSGAGALPTH